MREKIREIEAGARAEISEAQNSDAVEKVRIKYLGRKGLITELFKKMGDVPAEEKGELGRLINSLKEAVASELDEKATSLSGSKSSKIEKIDITLPGIASEPGTKHPVSKSIEEICGIFISLGFKVVEGPEIENEHYNFEALNIPLEHPSRDAFDTFYLAGKWLLRSHTSPVQARFMEKNKPPFAIVIPGKVYRPDATDASHSFMFHQVEGLVVGDSIKFSDLKGVLTVFAKRFFGEKIKMRFRPSFFPFTEPSAEVDISCILCSGGHDSRVASHTIRNTQYAIQKCSLCGGKGWLEILGAGMVNPKVFKNVGYDPEKITGFAFGMGVERITILKYGITDIRLFFDNDIRFLKQF
ncbi:MAG: phenylalanine--tRNA ligase subunit alpha [Candidatus Omnitrophica bacterium]|nr:phenylalanine--tRNA ligase subunit alpha [Candidatus Omnitrophota bacterium]